MQNKTLLAAIDLGSNSFRLEIGRFDHGHIQRTEYLKETVRQGNGLDEDRNLSPDAMQRGWDCLARFAERLSGFKNTQVRAVATQTLREARNRDIFLERANQVLGFPIDVISGREEARLIYQGVSHFLPQSKERRLVLDIGGRSTELILGQGLQASTMESYRVGSVAWSMRYFPQAEFSAAAFERAEVAAKAVLDEALNLYKRESWDQAYGSSGTVGAVGDVLLAHGYPEGIVTREGLDWLRGRLLKAQSADKLKLEGIKEDRRAVIGGGLSVLQALFDLLNIDHLNIAQGALRHGVLYDLIDRESEQTDLRANAIERLALRFNVDANQTQRVGKVADYLWRQLVGKSADNAKSEQRQLTWAAQVHEIGHWISHSNYHKHGAYILDNTEALGFAQQELHTLSLLVLGHRGKLKKLDVDLSDKLFASTLLCLRLAVLLCHARRDPDYQDLKLQKLGAQKFDLTYPRAWGKKFPQSLHLLREECVAWQKSSWTMTVTELS